jgi:hypothetical protein
MEIKMSVKRIILAVASTVAMTWLPVTATAATTGLDFAGGCPEAMGGLCANGSNATEANVAEILGVNQSLVSEVFSGFSYTGVGATSGTWMVTDPSITHISFKSDGYFILGAVTAGSGDWDNDTSALGGWDLSLAICPLSICSSPDTNSSKDDRLIGPRAYVDADFLNNGGSIAALSNVRAFSVVPVPAAVWLFGSGLLGLVAVSRRKA